MYDDFLKLLPVLSTSELERLGREIAGLLTDRTGATYTLSSGTNPVPLPGPGLPTNIHYGNRPKPPFWVKVPTSISTTHLTKGAYAINGPWADNSTPEGSLAVVGKSDKSIAPADKTFYLLRRKRGASTKCYGLYDVEGFEFVLDSNGASRDLSGYPALKKADGKPIAPILRALVEANIPIVA